MEPVTLTILICLGIGSLVGGGGAVVILKWNEIVTLLTGNRIAVLGARETGKSTLLDYIARKILRERYNATTAPKNVASTSYTADGIEFLLKDTIDVGGGEDDVALGWKQRIDKSDIIFYLFRVDLLVGAESQAIEKRILSDLAAIRTFINNEKKKKPVILIGTHSDLDQDFPDSKIADSSKAAQYEAKIKKLPLVEKMQSLATVNQVSSVFIGSLFNEGLADDLLKNIFLYIRNSYGL